MSQKIDPSKLSCCLVCDTPEGDREMWIRCNNVVVAIGKVIKNSHNGTITAQNPSYCVAAKAYLEKNFPEYNWK